MNILGGDGAYGCLDVDAEADSPGVWEPCGGLGCAAPCGVLERAAGSVRFRIEYGHVAWEGEEAGSNDSACRMEVDKGGSHLPFRL